jgi:hypothetical protein
MGLKFTLDDPTIQKIMYKGQTPPTDFITGGLADVDSEYPYTAFNEGYSNRATEDHENQHMWYSFEKKVLAKHHQLHTREVLPVDSELASQRRIIERSLRNESVCLGSRKRRNNGICL